MGNSSEIERARIEFLVQGLIICITLNTWQENPRNNPRPLFVALGQALIPRLQQALFNTLDLIGNKIVCARVANDVSGNSLVFQMRFTWLP